MDSSVYANKDFVLASKRWVNVYCSKDSGHGTEKVGTVEMCKIHPSLKCADHVACDASASGLFFSGTHRAPGPETFVPLDDCHRTELLFIMMAPVAVSMAVRDRKIGNPEKNALAVGEFVGTI